MREGYEPSLIHFKSNYIVWKLKTHKLIVLFVNF